MNIVEDIKNFITRNGWKLSESEQKETIKDVLEMRINMNQTYTYLEKFDIPVLVEYGTSISVLLKKFPIFLTFLSKDETYFRRDKINYAIKEELFSEECGLTSFVVNVILYKLKQREVIE